MAPFEIRKELLKHLRAVRRGFFTPEAAAALNKMTDAEKAAAGKTLVDANIAIRKLENIELAAIANELKQFEDDLTKATERLGKALENVRQFKKVLDTATDVIGLLARIAKLVGIPIPA